MENFDNKSLKDNRGQTPLHAAVIQGDLDACKEMIEFFDDIHPRDNEGLTPLDWASRMGDMEVYELISNHPKNSQIKN